MSAWTRLVREILSRVGSKVLTRNLIFVRIEILLASQEPRKYNNDSRSPVGTEIRISPQDKHCGNKLQWLSLRLKSRIKISFAGEDIAVLDEKESADISWFCCRSPSGSMFVSLQTNLGSDDGSCAI